MHHFLEYFNYSNILIENSNLLQKKNSFNFILHPISHTNWFSNLVCATFPTGAASWKEFSSTIFFLIVETIFWYVPVFMVILQNLHTPSPAGSCHWRACTTCDTSSIICLILAILSSGLDFLYPVTITMINHSLKVLPFTQIWM